MNLSDLKSKDTINYIPTRCKIPKPTIEIKKTNDVNKYYDKWLKENELQTLKDIDIEKLHYILSTIDNRDDFFYNIKCIDDNKFLDIKCNNGVFEPKCVEHRLKGGKKTKKKNKKKIKGNKYKSFIKRKQKNKLSKKNSKWLDKRLQTKLCKCIKGLKSSKKKYKKGSEYPICLSSIYTKRGFKPPKKAIKRCKN